MEMKVRKGAIVSFSVLPQTTIAPFSCKVLDINENEVVIVEQAFVSKEEIPKWSGVKTKDLNHRVSVDFGNPISIPRKYIKEWKYSTIPDDTSMYYSSYNPSDVKKMPQERVNSYDVTGLCKGYGEYLE